MNRLKAYLTERGIKQEWLSQKTGIPNNTISRIVNGQTPTLHNAQRIARALSMTVDDLWPLEEDVHGEL